MQCLESAPPDLFITDQLALRGDQPADHLREKQAIQDLARHLGERPTEVLPRFVDLAIALTGGISAGLSLFEPHPAPGQFRWRYVRGALATFENATTPRHHSPCGVTLDRSAPVLSLHPERFYEWIADADIVVPEVLLVPLHTSDAEPLGTLWIVAEREGHFNLEHARIATELAAFVGVAIKLIRTEQRLQTSLDEQEMLTKEMSHRVKNLFAVSDIMVRMAARSAGTKEEMAEILSGRFHALASAHGLVRRSFSPDGTPPVVSDLVGLLATVFSPHERGGHDAQSRFSITGPSLACGERALNGIALVFHELATNAAKYGALTVDDGRVEIHWIDDGETVTFDWREHGGPRVEQEPQTSGFGGRLLRDTIESQFRGSWEQAWHVDGLAVRIKIPLSRLAH